MKNSTDRPCTASGESHSILCLYSRVLIFYPEIIGRARNRTKVFEANDRSTYSNVAFSLLGQVLERATGKDYAQIIAASITGPLGMDNTTIRKPKDSDGIIPWGPVNDWAQDLGPDTP
jgi:CubicO group peptidase (beta-lactamase class C family)